MTQSPFSKFPLSMVLAAAISLGTFAGPLHAAQVRQFMPQGELSGGQQRVTAVFTEDVVAAGNRDAASPFQIRCDVPSSYSYWEGPKTWVYNLDRPLVLGQQCTFTLNPAAKTLKGESFTGKSSFTFKVSKFQVSSIQPSSSSSANSEIHEDQVFVIKATGPVNLQTIKQQVWCESDAVGQKMPVQILDAKAQARLPEEYQPEKSTHPANVMVFQCTSNLPPKSKVQVVWGKGPNSVEERFAYTVREPFRATTNCQRTQAGTPCSPLSPLVLNLSSPVQTALLLKARLKHGKDVILPLDQGNRSGVIEETSQSITFPAPLPAQASLVLELPKDVKDEAGRPLINADQFPLTIQTDVLPPLAKFPGQFGIVEWKEGGVLPITLRNVEAKLPMRSKNFISTEKDASSGHSLQQQRLTDDAQVIATINALNKFESQSKFRSIQINGEAREYQDNLVAREVSFLQGKSNLAHTQLPKPAPSSETEVVGVPLGKPGFYVLEIQSRLLGNALLVEPKPMFVRASALVTNMAVHLKIGRNNSLVWVTSLDKGLPVPGAEVRVSDCDGKSLWLGRTDAQGRALVEKAIQAKTCASAQEYLFASARLGEDYSFVRSNWNEGIEPWRFGVVTWGEQSQAPMHTVLDRTLFKPGETVHMKHFARRRTSSNFEFPDAAQLPKTLRIVHTGEGTEYTQNIQWDKQGAAINQWTIPTTAKMGQYSIELTDGREGLQPVGEFRVSDFRLPVFTGSVQAGGDQKHDSPLGQKEVPINIGLSFLNGGPAKNLKVEVSSILRNKWLYFPAYPDFNFSSYLADETLTAFKLSKGLDGEKLLLDKEQHTLDAQGTTQVKLALNPMPTQASELYTEVSFPDPNGEIQTIRGTTTWWPSGVLLGFKNGTWADTTAGKKRIQLLALNTQGKPKANQTIQVVGSRQVEYSHRRRVVGGFYAYENRSEYSDLGTLCSGKTDDKGLMWCEVSNLPTGRIHFMAQASDEKGLTARAHTDLMVGSGGGDDWYAVGSQDRMDVLPEKTLYKPGEVARIQVRTPFADGTALVAIESESVLETLVVPLSRFKPMVEIPMKAEWGPNVFVSVLNVRGRVQPLTWTSFFSWGWREPMSWLKQWWSPDQATAMVDLAKPSFRIGLNGFEVGTQGFELKVQVAANQANYKPGDKVKATLKVIDPQGKPVAAGTEVLLAVVDQALLELRPNESWNLLDQMLQARPYLVETSTAQMQVVGKRHFGKKAVPAGGGGGKAPARELFDTLVTWQPSVKLNAKGEATVEFAANDSLSAFQMVAIATSGPGLFGTGKAQYQTRQDLQLISGLPPLVREGDQVHGMITVRNSTPRTMQITVTPSVEGIGGLTLKAQTLSLKPESAQELSWVYKVPEQVSQSVTNSASVLSWNLIAQESSTGNASDEIKIAQQVKPKVPVQVQQSGVLRVDGALNLPLILPQGALPGRGGVNVTLTPSLAVLPVGVTQFFEQYSYTCLEQQVSKAMGLKNQNAWNNIAAALPSYQDPNGLLHYFPVGGSSQGRGDSVLTAYVLNMALLGDQLYGFKLSAEQIQSLKRGLTAYVEGRVTHAQWSPREDTLQRKLQALEALTRAGDKPVLAANALEVNVLKQPTSALIDWYLVLQRVPAIKQQATQLQAVQNELRNRLTYAGGRLLFSTEDRDFWWWMMSNADVNAFRLLEAVLNDPAWKHDLAQLLKGALDRQIKGRWLTTTANAWASVAIERYARQEERQTVAGTTVMHLAKAEQQYKWPNDKQPDVVAKTGSGFQTHLPWAVHPNADLKLQHQGSGKPWVDYQIIAAVPTTKPVFQGYQLKKTITPVQQREKGKTSRGDVWRVDVEIDAGVPMTWVALTDAIPAGAKILGDGDGRDSQIIQAQGVSPYEKIDSADSMRMVSPTFVERGFDSYRSYFDYLPKGKHKVSYTVRLNNSGQFNVPASRIEAMYAPGTFAELPNADVVVHP